MLRDETVESDKLAVTQNWTQDTWFVQPVRFHWAISAGQPPALTILYMYCTGGIEMPHAVTHPLAIHDQYMQLELVTIVRAEGWSLS